MVWVLQYSLFRQQDRIIKSFGSRNWEGRIMVFFALFDNGPADKKSGRVPNRDVWQPIQDMLQASGKRFFTASRAAPADRFACYSVVDQFECAAADDFPGLVRGLGGM